MLLVIIGLLFITIGAMVSYIGRLLDEREMLRREVAALYSDISQMVTKLEGRV